MYIPGSSDAITDEEIAAELAGETSFIVDISSYLYLAYRLGYERGAKEAVEEPT